MKLYLRLWAVILTILLIWVYFIFISPKIFHHKTLVVPDVVHLSLQEAKDKLDQESISYQITYVDAKKEETLKTIPYAGTKIKADYVIDLFVGRLTPQAYHSYLGQVFSDVSEEIEKMCLDAHIDLKVEYQQTDKMMSGIIMKESLIDGSLLNEQTELVITISMNQDTFTMPHLVGMKIEDALKVLEEYHLRVNINYYTTPIEEDVIILQSTAPGTIVQKNNTSSLDLYVSRGMSNITSMKVDELVEVFNSLDYELEMHYVDSNENPNKLVAFKCQKLYDIDVTKYILWVTK